MLRLFTRLCLVLLYCLLAACGGSNGAGILRLDPGPDSTAPSPRVTNDPAGPIPSPILPPDLESAASAARADTPPETAGAPPATPASDPETEGKEAPAAPQRPNLEYDLRVLSPDAPELVDAFLAASHLEQLRDNSPGSIMGLDQRMRSDLTTATDVLHSFGYYSGKAHGKISRKKQEDGDSKEPSGRASGARPRSNAFTVTITFEPGPQYTVGATRVFATEPHRLETRSGEKRLLPAATLADVGLAEGSPAIAGRVLDAVSAAHETFRDRGYPFATTASTRYTVDHASRTLDAEIVIDSGPLVYMDGIAIKGDSPVRKKFFEALSTWTPGQTWNQSLVEDYRNALRQSGIFSAVELSPAEEEDGEGHRAVVTEVTPAPARTVGGALKFDTDFGPGVQAYWEHRNITGRGDRLRIEMPVWADLQELVATYRLRFFLRNDQDLTARAAFRSENTDAYDLKSALATVGLERRLSRHWTGSVAGHLEVGELTDPDDSRQEYLMVGMPAWLAYSDANSLLDATRGVRLNIAVAPYTGEYHEDFTVVRSRVEAQAFLPIIGEDALVLALRGMYGMIFDTNAQDVPASIRFYVGGGGSVRGYDYQSLGPRNDSRDPLGGASAVELSSEARIRFSETWGMVAFIDGGMAYPDATADFSEEELRWGAGIGVRLFTVIGPVRLDVATPLNPRDDDGSLQIYFSIGQSF